MATSTARSSSSSSSSFDSDSDEDQGTNELAIETLSADLRARLSPKLLRLYDTEMVPMLRLLAMQRAQESLEKKENQLELEASRLWQASRRARRNCWDCSKRRVQSLAHDIEMCKQAVAAKREELAVYSQEVAAHRAQVQAEEAALAHIICKIFLPQPAPQSSAPPPLSHVAAPAAATATSAASASTTSVQGDAESKRARQVVPSTEGSLAGAFRDLMNNVDAAAHMLSFMSVKEALTGLGAASRAFKAQTDVTLPVVKLHYIPHSRISPLSRFTSLRHLMIGDTGGAHCLEGLAAISASLESLVIDIKSPAIVKAFNTLCLPKLKHLHVGDAQEYLFDTNVVLNPAAFPLLETLGMKKLDPYLHDLLVVQQAFPQLKRLAFEAVHPLCGGEPWYLEIPDNIPVSEEIMVCDLLRTFPQTPALKLTDLSDNNSYQRRILQDAGLSHLTHLHIKYIHRGTLTLRAVAGTLQQLVIGCSDVSMNLEAGSLLNLRKLVLKQDVHKNVMIELLEATTDSFEELWFAETYSEMRGISTHVFTEPCLESIKRATFLLTPSWLTSGEYLPHLQKVLLCMTALEEVDICFSASEKTMNSFLCRFIQAKEAGRLPHLKLLKLMKHKWLYGRDEHSTCSTPMALLLLLWLHEEADGCARGLRVPYIPLPRDSLLLRMLQAARGDEVGKGVKTWEEW